MPRLIHKRKKPNPVPRCGRRMVYVSPHSPFQKLVESERRKWGLSIKEVADRVSDLTPREPALNPGSFWIWLRNVNGFPHPKSCTKGRLVALARVLRVPLPRLQETLDASRHLFTQRELVEPAESQLALEQFIEIIKNDRRTNLPRARLLNLAESLLDSARRSKIR